jgi:hypothetical protein
MKSARRVLVALLIFVALASSPTQAQIPFLGPLLVYDASNYAQAVAQVTQLARQYAWWVNQARRLPADMRRYVAPEVTWRLHNLQTAYPWARPMLRALTDGDPTGQLYLRSVDRLPALEQDFLDQLPVALRQRVTNAYASVELADSIAQMSVHQTGAIRTNGPRMLDAIRALESDAIAAGDDFHTQTALLNKINGTSVLGLRIAERSTQFLMHTLEQLMVDNRRKRDAEAKLLNATLEQWEYGLRYGQHLYSRTAANLDHWRQY